MKIIELNDKQFKNYSKLHSNRNYKQTTEYAMMKRGYSKLYLGLLDEESSNLMGATLILVKRISRYKMGIVPGNFLIDYHNEELFKNFVNYLKEYLKKKNFIYLKVENKITYKIFNKDGNVEYFDTDLVKLFDNLNFKRSDKKHYLEVILKAGKTADDTYNLFNNTTKESINLASERAISIYKDDKTSVNTIFSLNTNSNKKEVEKIINYFNTDSNKAEVYLAKINPEKYVNNYRFLIQKEDEINSELSMTIQNMSINKTEDLINKKMESDKLINRYNSEIIKATNLYSKYSKEVTIGSILILRNNREIYFLDESYNKELEEFYTSHLIKWEIMKKYIDKGYNIFNFGSIKDINNNDNDYLFKVGFGGKIYEYIGTYDLVINMPLYSIFKIIDTFEIIRKKFKKKNSLD